MPEAGILKPDERLELIRGEILKMSPISCHHRACVNRLVHVFTRELGDRVVDEILG